jgi:transcriptional regulator with XRE-family HTH domain
MQNPENKFPYDASGKLLDYLAELTGAQDGRDLSAKIGVAFTTISRIRNGWFGVSAAVRLKIFETTGTPFETQSQLIGDAQPLPRTHTRAKDRTNDKSGKLFDYLRDKLRAKNDADMARKAGVSLPYVSLIRRGKREPGDLFLMHIHNATGISIKKMRELIAGEKP